MHSKHKRKDYDNPSPPTPARIAALPGSVKFTAHAPTAPVPPHIIIAPHLISKEDGRILESLEYVIKSSPSHGRRGVGSEGGPQSRSPKS